MRQLQSQSERGRVRRESLDLYSFRHLEFLLSFSRAQLRELSGHAAKFYKPFYKEPKIRPFARRPVSNKKRLIDNPKGMLKIVQKRINQRLLKPLLLPEHLLGGVPGKCIRDNAFLHLGSPCIVTLDIKKFFPSITPLQIHRVWRLRLNCSPRIAALLTRLTTFRGYLPQGAPTSTLLANLVLSSADCGIKAACEAAGIRYSSWVDDLAFSGPKAREVVQQVVSALMRAGFRLSHKKIKVMGAGDRKTLNKLVLSRFVSVERKYLSQIRAGIHNLRVGRVLDTELALYIRSLEGSINYVHLMQPQKAAKFRSQLTAAIQMSCLNQKAG
jgi:RNA-directed DNA polymerase